MKTELRSVAMAFWLGGAAIIGALWGFKYVQVRGAIGIWSRSASYSLLIGDHREAVKVLSGAVGTLGPGLVVALGASPDSQVRLGDTREHPWVIKHLQPIAGLVDSSGRSAALTFYVSYLDTWVGSSVVVMILLLAYTLLARRSLVRMSERAEQQRKIREIEFLNQVARQVAHDIRSPIGALGMLRQTLTGLDAEQVEVFDSALGRIHSIANDFLSNPMRETFPVASFDQLQDVLSRVVTEKRVELGKRAQIRFSTSGTSAIANTRIDLSSLQRIISNLVNNSVEATMGLANIQVQLDLENQHINISVADSGRGMSAERVASLGDQPASSGKSHQPHSGFGLGLPYAFSQVRAWGGEISIISELGHGTTVRLSLPVIPSSSAPSTST